VPWIVSEHLHKETIMLEITTLDIDLAKIGL
jgi:hypothetical protein